MSTMVRSFLAAAVLAGTIAGAPALAAAASPAGIPVEVAGNTAIDSTGALSPTGLPTGSFGSSQCGIGNDSFPCIAGR